MKPGLFDGSKIHRDGYSAETSSTHKRQQVFNTSWALKSQLFIDQGHHLERVSPQSVDQQQSHTHNTGYQFTKRYTRMGWEEAYNYHINIHKARLVLCNHQHADRPVVWHGWPEGGAVVPPCFIWIQQLMRKLAQTLVKAQWTEQGGKDRRHQPRGALSKHFIIIFYIFFGILAEVTACSPSSAQSWDKASFIRGGNTRSVTPHWQCARSAPPPSSHRALLSWRSKRIISGSAPELQQPNCDIPLLHGACSGWLAAAQAPWSKNHLRMRAAPKDKSLCPTSGGCGRISRRKPSHGSARNWGRSVAGPGARRAARRNRGCGCLRGKRNI